MNKKILLFGISLLVIGIVLIVNKFNNDSLKPNSNQIINIVDRTETENLVCDEALEYIGNNRNEKYYLSCIKSHYIDIYFENGSITTLKREIENGFDYSLLDKYDIYYIVEETASEVGEKSNIILSDIVEIEIDNINNGYIDYRVINNSEIDYEYGKDYKIEIKKDNTWYTLEPSEEFYNNAMLYFINSNSVKEERIDYYMTYGVLETGEYRIVVSIDEYYIGIEFLVEN